MEAYVDLLDDYAVCDYREFRLLGRPEVDFGRDAVIEMLREYWGAFVDYSVEAEEFVDAGTAVVIAIVERGRGKGSGAPFERRMAWLWSFRRGKIVRLEPFRTKEEALAAVGLAGSDAAT